jgi:hypothetical protein
MLKNSLLWIAVLLIVIPVIARLSPAITSLAPIRSVDRRSLFLRLDPFTKLLHSRNQIDTIILYEGVCTPKN